MHDAEDSTDARTAQQRAADPAFSAFVSANAGSGKTRALADRVSHLLYKGARPDRILCLTYTRAAAAEMRNRLISQLGGWAMADDPTLARQLAERGIRLPGKGTPARRDALARARRLFAQALETPGGLRIQTIHGCCQAILRRFPLEAGVTPHFTLAEESAQKALLTQAGRAVAEAHPEHLAAVSAFVAEKDLLAFLQSVLRARAEWKDLATLDEAALLGRIRGFFGTSPSAAAEEALPALPMEKVERLIELYETHGSKASREATLAPLHMLREGMARGDAPLVRRAAEALIFTPGGERRKFGRDKAIKKQDPCFETYLEEIADAYLNCEAAGRTLAALAFVRRFLDCHERRKNAAGALDYDDLILRTQKLLTRSAESEWVRYRLDWQLDHILVDEGQDTSPSQWAVVSSLFESFFEDASARKVKRTVFVVGDAKQSIYGFQGADPDAYETIPSTLARKLAPVGERVVKPKLMCSFRSGQPILDFVDRLFAKRKADPLSIREPMAHRAFHKERAGRVDLWPLLKGEKKAKGPEWYDVAIMPTREAPGRKLAWALAGEIRRMIDEETMPGTGERVRAGDILVLVRNREPIARALVQRLQSLGVPVAGQDRLRLGESLAVKDMLALIQVALTPEDDYALACLLRTPLCDFSDDDLYRLAHARKGSLWQALRARANEKPLWQEAARFIADMLDQADYKRPFEFLTHALTLWRGRTRLLARLGGEAADAIDELLAQSLIYEEEETASLQGFLRHMLENESDVKRELSEAGGDLRVMTVHGAKGLESKIVILPDTLHKPELTNAPGIWRLTSDQGESLLLPAIRNARRGPVEKRAEESWKAREMREHWRLFYVALTRASHWLIVAGASSRTIDSDHWYSAASATMDTLPCKAIGSPVPVFRSADFRRFETPPEKTTEAGKAAAREAEAELPAWVRRNPPRETLPSRARAPSAAHEEAEISLPPPSMESLPRHAEAARRRGLLVHLLLEKLPELAPDLRARAGAAILSRKAPDSPEAEREAILQDALGVMAHPELAPLLKHRLAEAELHAPDGALPAIGRVDLLSVGETRIAIVDFKTDASPPDDICDTPEAYCRQLACYRGMLARIYPERSIDAGLLWVTRKRLDWLPKAMLDRALA